MKAFHDIRFSEVTSDSLKNDLNSRGYVLVRDVLPRADVAKLLRGVTDVLSQAGWLQRERDPLDRIAAPGVAFGDPDPAFKRTYQQVFNLEEFHALPHHSALSRVMRMIVGDRPLVHPKPIGRLIFPNCDRLTVHPHQDYRFMGGDPECFTVWIPLHDCPLDVGPLRILESSHRFGYRKHEDEDLHVPEIPENTIAADDWSAGSIYAGDVLIFHSLTVHAASPNVSNQLRISLDCRFQDYRKPIHPANLAFAGDSGKSWEKVYAGWHSDHLKYYWKRLPLTFHPSRSEIEQFALLARSDAQRARYGRILTQIS
ncbi:MAG TPA: phytanoyl-CoA dioxygenase family protein [Terracidiphilus sp.]|jgi:ectoine hydroxylase-related dioxygenase (phytanoyl-CoA dioxygenase family)|nr:phytanoyl-CoA dioxygenase family protein [Terracidiphilus sp.]